MLTLPATSPHYVSVCTGTLNTRNWGPHGPGSQENSSCSAAAGCWTGCSMLGASLACLPPSPAGLSHLTCLDKQPMQGQAGSDLWLAPACILAAEGARAAKIASELDCEHDHDHVML